MKKLLLIVSVIPIVIASFMLQFLPDKVPMHFGIDGKVDRWGDKAEFMIFAGVILVTAIVMWVFISFYEKKSRTAKEEKVKEEAKINAKIMKIISISVICMLDAFYFILLYLSYKSLEQTFDIDDIDVIKLTCILLGVMFVVMGNVLPKTKKNGAIGIRMSWSMYNDNTWRKTNRLAGILLMLEGVITIVISVFVSGMVCITLIMVILTVIIIVTTIYAKKVYDIEKSLLKE